MASTVPVLAQDDVGDVEQVVVSASRISIAGYTQPTPVTVVGAADIERDAQANLGSVFHNLPTFGSASSPDTTTGAEGVSSGSAGKSQVNMRNLGVGRTLVLVNGNRMAAADLENSGPDLNMLPTLLIKRVDVVTGGASAAWGSDAVSGVVNIIMDTHFDGFKANAEFGVNEWGNKQNRKAELAFGTGFLGGNGHVEMSLSYLDQPLNPLYSQADYFEKHGATALVGNPAYSPSNGQPQYITVRNAGLSTGTVGGLILSNPAGTGGLNANVLRGTQFVGPSATPTTFDFGTVYGGLSYGGSARAPAYEGQNDPLGVPVQNLAFYGHGSYRLFDNVTFSAELEAGESHTHNSSISYQPSVTVRADNAYIPAPVAAQMALYGIPSFVLGTTMMNNLEPGGNPLGAGRNLTGAFTTLSVREFYRGVAGFDGTIGDDWSWNATYQHSNTHRITRMDNTVIAANFNRAVDAVTVTAANRRSSGLALGSIACRSTLTDPTNGCAPLNLFGEGVASQQAIDYINPGADSPNVATQIVNVQQDTFSASVQGTLPWAMPAGKVAVALGFDYRKEAARQTANALALAKAYVAGNYAPFVGEYNTKEGFAEVNMPLLRDNIVQSLDFDAAGRLTDYSSSGLVETWKLGLVSQLNDDIRLRGSWSLDIRAPTVYELYNQGSFSVQSSRLPNGQTVNRLSGGNPALKPEISTTLSGGVVLTPHWLPGLSLSADWYSINIKGSIFTPQPSQIYDQCQAGVQVYCSAFVTTITGPQVNTIPLNAASAQTSGLDFQADYVTDFWDGKLSLGLLGNYMDEQTTLSAVGIEDTAGSLVNDTGGNGAPKFRSTFRITYDEGPVSATVQTRIVGSSHINNAYHEGSGPNSIDSNAVDGVAYLDLRGSWTVSDNYQLYAAVDNLANTPPPLIPYGVTEIHPGFYVPTNSNYFDLLGRVFRVGVRVQY
jgi:outer membrane receptor protein involved in Fe transport